ncbi:MAG: hypothetical protein GDA42_09250 [Ekhidna sp.]|nr:hypothetical protein [Ekhidna sp.]MBC6410626.1 hypothetical protein [Ekhidna sp.]
MHIFTITKWVYTLLFLTVGFGLFAQYQITGTVSDRDGDPLIGATIHVMGTAKGANRKPMGHML